ncbi:MAG TPA: trypsin-like peptidase domain-containing protein, partial [Candidatus Binatia bacterium]
ADLALVKIVKPPAGLIPVKLGDSSSIQVAEDIHVIGHPHGQLWSYTTGVVSQVRDNYGWEYSDGSKHFAKVLQLQTAINPGNSGGPVLDNNASMLGLVAMSEEGQNLNYAVAIDVIKDFVNNSLAARSRGGEPRLPTEKGTVYTASTKDGLSVGKTVYSNLVSYTVRDSKGVLLELIAETPEGAILTGTKPNAFGGFSEWTFKPVSGKTVSVKSSGVGPDLVTLAPGE